VIWLGNYREGGSSGRAISKVGGPDSRLAAQ